MPVMTAPAPINLEVIPDPKLAHVLMHGFLTTAPPKPTTTTPGRAAVLAALTQLGNSPTRIAESLYAAGIKGTQGDTGGCALAVYLQRVFPDTDIRVMYMHVSINPDRPGGYTTALPTAALVQFVDGFDCGAFPRLETNPMVAR